ncbi:MAG: riboflavin kinase, partial [candidate division WOR-3 bacterium]
GEFKNKNLKVKFHKFIRNDMKFDSVEELKKQIEKDINIGYTYFLKKGSNPNEKNLE